MSAFMMLAILMASSMGCIGLVPAREFMEDLRPEAKMIDVKIRSMHRMSLLPISQMFKEAPHIPQVKHLKLIQM